MRSIFRVKAIPSTAPITVPATPTEAPRGASVGVAGTVIGAVLGIAFTLNIDRIQDAVQAITGVNVFNAEVYYLTHLPARLDWGEVVKIVVLAFTLSLLATLYPSWRAARTDPVEALRHE